MEPDAVQGRNESFECRVILLGALRLGTGWMTRTSRVGFNETVADCDGVKLPE